MSDEPEPQNTEATSTSPSSETDEGAEHENDGVTLIDPNPELTEAKAEVSELQARLRAVSAAYRQLQEDVEATKERLSRAAEFQRALQRGETVAKMFDPMDSLKRSIDSAEEGDTKTGLEMVAHQFMVALNELGLESVSPDGMPFDPNFHEALSVMPVTSPEQDGLVLEVFSVGYRVGSRLLKPARVIIGKLEEADG
jgi:molecular chaperone GrpE